MKDNETFYTSDWAEWRRWLAENFETKTEVWFVFPIGKRFIVATHTDRAHMLFLRLCNS